MTAKACRLLCSILMTAVTSAHPTRSAAEAALRDMGKNGRADYDHDRRYRPLMLLATLSWFGLVERVTRIEFALPTVVG